jgi:hypothetical protein
VGGMSYNFLEIYLSIAMTAALVLPRTIEGISYASATRNPFNSVNPEFIFASRETLDPFGLEDRDRRSSRDDAGEAEAGGRE